MLFISLPIHHHLIYSFGSVIHIIIIFKFDNSDILASYPTSSSCGSFGNEATRINIILMQVYSRLYRELPCHVVISQHVQCLVVVLLYVVSVSLWALIIVYILCIM